MIEPERQTGLLQRREGAWSALYPEDAAKLLTWIASASAIESLPSRIIRDDRHGFVGVIDFAGERIIAKSPRYKDDRPWIRLWTRFRESHAFRTLRIMRRLELAGLPIPKPLLALEQRRGGRVMHSWIFYRFVEGIPCSEKDYAEICDTLRRLHALGWRHGDPHFENFLATENGVVMLDMFSTRKRCGRFSDWYDFILLRNSNPAIVSAIDFSKGGWPLRIASAYDRWIHSWRPFKRGVRSLLGANKTH